MPALRGPSRSLPQASCPTRRSRRPLLMPPPGLHREPSRSRSDWPRELAHLSIRPLPFPPLLTNATPGFHSSQPPCLNTRRPPPPQPSDSIKVVYVRTLRLAVQSPMMCNLRVRKQPLGTNWIQTGPRFPPAQTLLSCSTCPCNIVHSHHRL